MSFVNVIADDSTALSSKMMELSMERQKVIANNMANADTPGYIRRDIDFSKKLAEIIQSGDMTQLSSVTGTLVEDNAEAPRLDGNNVAVASEMNQMMQNGVLFNLMARAYNTKMNIIRSSMESN